MRWPIQVQLLLPILLVVLVALALSSAASGYFGSSQVRRQQENNLRRVVGALTEAKFPLTEYVLQQMSGLSGAEFVLFGEDGQVKASTCAADVEDLGRLATLPADAAIERLSSSPVIHLAGHSFLAHRVPVMRQPYTAEPGSLVVLYREDRWREAARQAAYPALIAGAASAVAAVLVASLLAQRLVRPLKLLGDQTATLVGGRFHRVEVPRRNDEIRDLALCINRMSEQLSRYESEVRRNERLATLGQLGAGMAHQLRNSATGARMDIELHQRECPLGSEEKPLHVALRQLRLMESYLQRFLSLGRSPAARRERVVLNNLLADALELVRPAYSHNKVDLRCANSPVPLAAPGDPDALRELWVNLLLNALEAAQRRPEAAPTVLVELQPACSGRASVRVMDSGPGPSSTTADRLFEPFVSEKPDGTGLGLFVARQIVDAHGGTIAWRREGEMTCFEVELPLVPADGEHGPPACG